MISILEPIFQGQLADLGQALVLSPSAPPGTLPVTMLIDDVATLKEALSRHAAFLGYDRTDLRPVASAWSMAYLAALLPPFSAAATLLEHVFPVAAKQTHVRLGSHGAPVAFHITMAGAAMPQADTWARYAPLLQAHLDPLFAAVTACTRLPSKILWGNTARHLQGIFDTANQLMPGMPRLEHDRRQLLDSPQREGQSGGLNPLHARVRCVELSERGAAAALVLHRQCCLYYLLPDHDYCQACPLAPGLRHIR